VKPSRLRLLVAEQIAAKQLWRPGQRVTVAVSGGADSVALLHMLHATQGMHRGVLRVATVDHGLREESASDAAWVAALCAQLSVPCDVLRIQAAPDEASLREARYAALFSLGGDVIATGHHAQDAAETLLLQAMRGGGLAVSGMSREGVVRPLLGVHPEHLRLYLKGVGVDWREDASNADRRYLRNRLRHDVLPLLESARAGAVRQLAKTAAQMRSERRALEELVAKFDPWDDGWPGDALREMSPEVLRCVLRRRISGLRSGLMDRLVDGILSNSLPVDLGTAGTAVVDSSGVIRIRKAPAVPT